MTLLQFEHVSLERGRTSLITDFQWQVKAGQHWVILGPNGAGKSTLARLAMARIWPTQGQIAILGQSYAGHNVQELAAQVGFFQPAQQDQLQNWHSKMTVLDTVMTGFDGSIANYNQYSSPQHERAQELIRKLFASDLQHYGNDSKICQLSTGERRQVLLLRSIVHNPGLLLLDEPYESLDIPTRYKLEQLLEKLIKSELVASVSIMHRLDEIPDFVNQVLLLKHGRILKSGKPVDVINSKNISELYELPLIIEEKKGRYFCQIEGHAKF